MSEQVKGIPELKTSAEKRASYRQSHGEHLNRRAVFELLDDIDTLEQALAALEARNRELESAARGLVDAMETCHICKGTLLVSEEPAHCEDCSRDCECHEEPECLPIYEFHRRLRAALKGAS